MKKIYIVGACMEKSSLGIYARYLMNELKKKYEVYDERRQIDATESLFSKIVGYIRYGIKLFIQWGGKDELVIYTHNISFFPPLFWSKNRIIIVHDFFYYDKDFFKGKGWFWKYIMYTYCNTIHKFLFLLTFKRVDRIVAISGATKKEIVEKFGKTFIDKIEVIYNGMDTSAFQPIKDDSMQRTDPYLLYVGSELGRKNLKNIISAFALVHKKYPTLKLIKAPIESDTEYRNQTLQYIEQNGLEVGKDVLLVNEYLSLEKLVSLYQHAEIFLFPTLKEGFGFPIIEAQSCGVPVITTHYEPMKELVPYKEMTVDPHDPEDIAQKIITILENPELKKKMIADGLEYVKQFSWENTAKQFSQLIDTMA